MRERISKMYVCFEVEVVVLKISRVAGFDGRGGVEGRCPGCRPFMNGVLASGCFAPGIAEVLHVRRT
jgi:hypothetical protein